MLEPDTALDTARDGSKTRAGRLFRTKPAAKQSMCQIMSIVNKHDMSAEVFYFQSGLECYFLCIESTLDVLRSCVCLSEKKKSYAYIRAPNIVNMCHFTDHLMAISVHVLYCR